MKKNIYKYKKYLLLIIPMIILFFVLLGFWPGIYTYDSNNQWEQVVSGNITSGHPFFTTYFLLLLSKIWESQTILLIYQILLFSTIWYYVCKEMLDEGKSYKKLLIYTIIMCFVPIISIYSITVWKDIAYSYYLLSIIFLLYRGIKSNFKYSTFELALIGLLLALIFSYRYNGMIVAILLLCFFAYLQIKNKRYINFKKSGLILIVFIIFLSIISIPKNYYLSKSEVNENKSESLSTMDGYITWMLGAHLQNDYVSDEDLSLLDGYIPIKEWKETYNPYLINATNLVEDKDVDYYLDNQKEIRAIFMKYSLKHPLTIAKHYLKADALLWSPFPIGYVYQYDFKTWDHDYSFSNQESSKIPFFEKYYEKVINISMKKPIRIIMYQPATILYLCIFFVVLLSKKIKKIWVVLIPMIFNIISLVPINLAQDLRYVYINYLTLAFIFLVFCLNYTMKDIVKIFKKGR